MPQSKMTLAVIIGNRGFFPDVLASEGRTEILSLLDGAAINAVALSTKDTKSGAVETYEDSKKCAALFRSSAEKIDGILVSLPNFGDERAIADTIRLSGLQVPVLVQAYPDEADKMWMGRRRDSFCGKLSACNNLVQYGIRFSLTSTHCSWPTSPGFRADLDWFLAVCRVVRTLRGARVGALGARPAAFNTVRFSEKLLQDASISVETLDLSDVYGRLAKLADTDPAVQAKAADIRAYVPSTTVSDTGYLRMAKLALVIDQWVAERELAGLAVQCWTSLEEFFGIAPCAVMSMLSNRLVPAACEVDVTGLLGMLALQAAAGTPSALVDWNNNYGDHPDKCVFFHCSNLPKAVFEKAQMGFQEILADVVGQENSYGTMQGRLRPGPFTYCRVSTDDLSGQVIAYTGQGEITADPLETFGGYGVAEIPHLQDLLRWICEHGYEHHVAINLSEQAAAIEEALGNYLRWDVYRHDRPAPELD